ncbi:cyclin-dependent kinase 12-like [Anoplopoma fimbria]|uniref:cyclin-dependent kinase 12-like n=1 Tax=Anoplopoma fimbria TaxID=229290 RepID=UPI0023EC7595|nr:cyclin-dependent kinase 12-like [Anoplopoma fimbria]XP_054460728.1 cyclin-dependent kinase 12-like [Anoplopoma fimbria]XP_054460729.1 cyclin-dependent kinase 12-like [Anoplopoma fimbria]XP_054460730.1 cyclin-dependent kinase 12-like [Anoplopoma fimbria]XP_054460731.1 cyclin-dependent kinase 12-like [Anoplopoma fimbria]
MQSNRSERSHRRQHSDRSSRQWDDYDHRWEERREPRRDIPQDSYQKYGGNGHSSSERTSRSREYSDSPKKLYSKDSLNRDLSRKSSARRRMSSPDWGTFEKKRQRFTEDDRDDNRYRPEPDDNKNRPSPDSFSRAHMTKDFKQMLPREEDFKYSKTPQDSRHRYGHEEFTHKQQHDDCRQSSGYYKDRVSHEKSQDCSQERKGSRDRSTKSYVKPRERNDSPPTDHEEYGENRTRFPLNGSYGKSFECDVTNQSPAVPEQKSTMGFQRFLNVLNKGVNVATLTKIVTQTSTEAGDRPHPATSFMKPDHPWSPSYAVGQQGSQQNTSHWSESKGFQRLASSEHRHRSFSPKGRSLSDEKFLQRGDGERSYFSSNSRSRSPSEEQKITLTSEDEHKHRQMQDVLQAIGMNLGSEELGQMSHRIQERLYGKKDNDRHRRGSRERDTRQAFSPRPHSRSSSSSSRSSFSPLNQEYYKKKDSCSAQRVVSEVPRVQVHAAVEYVQNSTSSTFQESDKWETYSKESTAACQAFSQNSASTFLKPSPTPAMPMYSPVNCSSLPYPPPPPKMPPNLPNFGPRLSLPPLPPFFPYHRAPPVNIFPAVLAQTRHLLPQHIGNPPFFNLPGINPIQQLNTTQKSKQLPRPRCLQVIETKQPG